MATSLILIPPAMCYKFRVEERYADKDVISYRKIAKGIDDVREMGRVACDEAEDCFKIVAKAVKVIFFSSLIWAFRVLVVSPRLSVKFQIFSSWYFTQLILQTGKWHPYYPYYYLLYNIMIFRNA